MAAVWAWMRSDPRNAATVVMVPIVVADFYDQVRWCRAHGFSVLSRAGNLAYLRARPMRSALTVALTVLPEAVGAAARLRRRF